MSTIRNQVVLIGNLGNDPEITNFEGGKKVAKFSMATNENYKNTNGENLVDTQWHNVVVWGNRANIAESYLKKGSEVCITGKLTHRSYEKEGVKHYITEVNANEIVMFGGKAQIATSEEPVVEHQE